MKKSFVIVNAYGHTNRGDSVLLDECISEIKRSSPSCQITVSLYEGDDLARDNDDSVFYTKRIGNRKPGQSVIFGLVYVLIALCCSRFKFLYFTRFFLPLEQRATLERIRDCDFVISAPGGYIHDTNSAFLVALSNILIGVFFRKKIILAPQSIGPIRGNIFRAYAAYVISKCDRVCVREEYSYEFVKKELSIGLKNVIRVGDAAFWNSDVVIDPIAIRDGLNEIGIVDGESFVGLTVVNWSFPNAINASQARERYIDSMSSLINMINARFDLRCVIFNQVTDDIEIANEICRKVVCDVVVDNVEREPRLLRGMISKSVVFVGTRFHSCIFALSSYVPTYAISYLPKTRYILQDLGLDSYWMSIDEMDSLRLMENVQLLIENNSKVSFAVCNAIEGYKARYRAFGDVVKEVADD